MMRMFGRLRLKRGAWVLILTKSENSLLKCMKMLCLLAMKAVLR